ncbi:hypothetical protein HMP09_2185 [Sphingomonas sp. HMP9]|nr:hypothetical protein HMP09_2185 [Sphingomonas sp. HMP9]
MRAKLHLAGRSVAIDRTRATAAHRHALGTDLAGEEAHLTDLAQRIADDDNGRGRANGGVCAGCVRGNRD